MWLGTGNTGTETEFLNTLTGPQGVAGLDGADGQNGINGVDGLNGVNGINGTNGQDGLSAYQVWLGLGNTGTETEFLTSLTGPQGEAGVDGADGQNGVNGTNGVNGVDGLNGTNGQDGANGTNGQDGLSAYQVWLGLGNTGTETEFLTSLTGPQGLAGVDGVDGVDGQNGLNGIDGNNGQDGTNGQDGLSAYQVWLGLGNTGTEQDFIAALVGQEGAISEYSEGFKVINTLFDQEFSIPAIGQITGSISDVQKNHFVIHFIPSYDFNNWINLIVTCFDENDQILDVYVERFKYQNDRREGADLEYARPTIDNYNATEFGVGFNMLGYNATTVVGPSFAQLKVWANGTINRIDYTISSAGSSTVSPRSPVLKIYTYQ